MVKNAVDVSKIDDAKQLIKFIKGDFPEYSGEWDEVVAGFPEQLRVEKV